MRDALLKGNLITKLSFLIMGLGNICRKQVVKGLLFLAVEAAFIFYMLMTGAGCLVDLVRLGGKEQQEVWNEALGIYQYTQGDNSLLMLLYGVTTIFICVGFLLFWRESVKVPTKRKFA